MSTDVYALVEREGLVAAQLRQPMRRAQSCGTVPDVNASPTIGRRSTAEVVHPSAVRRR